MTMITTITNVWVLQQTLQKEEDIMKPMAKARNMANPSGLLPKASWIKIPT